MLRGEPRSTWLMASRGKEQPVGSSTYGPPTGPFRKPKIWWHRVRVFFRRLPYRMRGMTRANQFDARWDKATGP
jgi:hypothetical protein